ncbi:MAG: hypothetical protein WCI72_03510 [archaeon]
MAFTFVPENGTVLDVLEKIAATNHISHFNVLGYTHIAQTDYSPEGGEINFNTPIKANLLADRDYIGSQITAVENSRDKYIAVSSLVRLNDSKPAHIFQLDYDQSLSLENLGQFVAKLEAVSKMGNIFRQVSPLYLFLSGGGYHAYGGVVKYEDFQEGLVYLRQSGIVDPKWIDLSRARGFSDLRISKNQSKRQIPSLIGKVTW